MHKLLFDTSVLIPLFRKGIYLEEILHMTRGSLLFFSSVVAQELYAGARSKKFLWQMDKLFYRFQKANRLIIPNHTDWREAGLALSRLGNRHRFDRVRRAALVNDSLIASSSRREGVCVLTANKKDFRLLQEEIDFRFLSVRSD